MIFTCLQKNENDPMVNTHIMVKGFGKNHGNNEFEKRPLSCKNNSPGSKADFSEKFLLGVWRLIWSRYDIK